MNQEQLQKLIDDAHDAPWHPAHDALIHWAESVVENWKTGPGDFPELVDGERLELSLDDGSAAAVMIGSSTEQNLGFTPPLDLEDSTPAPHKETEAALTTLMKLSQDDLENISCGLEWAINDNNLTTEGDPGIFELQDRVAHTLKNLMQIDGGGS